MTALLKLFGVTGAGKFVREKVRLFIEYLLIAAVVALCASSYTMWFAKERTEKKLELVQHRLIDVEEVNKGQERRIAQLNELRQRDSIAFKTLVTSYKTLAQRDKVARAKLDHLEKMNETVQGHFAHPVPVELRCLHDACPAGEVRNEARPAP